MVNQQSPPKIAGNEQTADPKGAHKARRPVRPARAVLAALLVVAAALLGGRAWRNAGSRVSTDDAYVTGSISPVSPQVSGTVKRVLVKDNEHVRAGQLLVVLDSAVYHANVEQARANLSSAIAQAEGAGVGVSLTAETGSAQTLQALGVVAQTEGAIGSAQEDANRAAAAVSSAAAAARAAQSQIGLAEAGLAAAEANASKAKAAVEAALAQLETAQASQAAAQASVEASRAAHEKALKDARRYSALAREGAVSQQVADNADTALDAASAQLEAAEQQASAMRAAASARKAEVAAAREQFAAANAAVLQARSQVRGVREQAKAALAGVAQAKAAREAARQVVAQAIARRDQAAGQLAQARTSTQQVAISRTTRSQALARVKQARAALDLAVINEGYTRIYAPVSGRVSKKSVEVGQVVQAGSPILAIVPDERAWIVANLKETQLAHVREGQPAEVRVDGVPGRVFKGRVDSISAATGATFALLPPDNATGNFTRIVQRLPVKITLDHGQQGTNLLRPGMSAVAVIRVK
jgi:membrane fusion protein (multidrug efflux system)